MMKSIKWNGNLFKRRFSSNNIGVSEIVGTILLLGITVTVFSTFAAYLYSTFPDPSSIRNSDLEVSYSNNVIRVSHIGGQELDSVNLRYILFVNDTLVQTGTFSESPGIGPLFKINDVWVLNYTAPKNSDLRFLVKHRITEEVLIEQELTVGEQADEIIDLEIKDSDIRVLENSIKIGDNVPVNVTVNNICQIDVHNVTVRLFDNGKHTGNQKIAFISNNSSATVQFSWTPTTKGIHDLVAKVVPLEAETIFYNNYASHRTEVEVSILVVFTDPNPYINDEDISFSNNYPLHGDTIRIWARVSNSGAASADATVYFYDGDPLDPDNLIDISTVKLAAGGQVTTWAYWTNNRGGEHDINVVLDDIVPLNVNEDDDAAHTIVNVLPTILIVNDDNHIEDGSNYDSYSRLTEAVEGTGFPYETAYVAKDSNGPRFASGIQPLSEFDIVIWTCGFEGTNTLTDQDIISIQQYLDSGGYLWLLGYDIVDELGPGHPFLRDYLKSGVISSLNEPFTNLNGTWGNPVTQGYNYSLNSLPADLHRMDELIPPGPDVQSGAGMFFDPGTSINNSVMYANQLTAAKTVFTPWDLTPLGNSNDRVNLTYLILNWFGAALGGSGNDLAISDLRISSYLPNYLDTITISAIVRNNGMSDMSNVSVAFYLNDELMDSFPDGVQMPMRVDIPGNGGEIVIEKEWIAHTVGIHDIQVIVDPYNEVTEISETNNDISYSDLISNTIQVQYTILLVDDDGSLNNGGGGKNVSENMSQALDRLGYLFDVRPVVLGENGPNVTVLKRYNTVIWMTGGERTNTLKPLDQINLIKYLEGNYPEFSYIPTLHVNLWVMGQDILDDLIGPGMDRVTPADSFVRKYMKVEQFSTKQGLPAILQGSTDDPITHGSEYPISKVAGDGGDYVHPISGAQQMYSGSPLGIRFSSNKYNVVFLPWEFTLIQDTREITRSNANYFDGDGGVELNGPAKRSQIPSTRAIEVVFEDDVEGGRGDWSSTGLWHISNHRVHSGASSWYFGEEGAFNYDIGSIAKGRLASGEISLVGLANCTLDFWHWLETENNPPFDTGTVEIRTRESDWNVLKRFSNSPRAWQLESNIDISEYDGDNSVFIRFSFDSIDSQNNAFEGWYVDDVKVQGDRVNANPVLTQGTVRPNLGGPDTNFTFSVVYTDYDNDTPLQATLYIDDEAMVMTSFDNTYSDGAYFLFKTKLNVGIHSYYFVFDDGTYTVKSPEISQLQGPLVSEGSLGSEVTFHKSEMCFLVLNWFSYPEERVELRTSQVDFLAQEKNPMIGNSYLLRSEVYNHGGQDVSTVVRMLDGLSVIDTISVFIPAGEHSTAEVLWTPLYTGNRLISVSVDPDDNLDEIFDFNNVILNPETYVYYFYDDMESEFNSNWEHDATVLNINGESALDYLSESQTDIISDWDWSQSDNTWIQNYTTSHSLNSSYFIYEPRSLGTTAQPVDVVLTIDESGSMDTAMQGEDRLYWAKEGAKGFIDNFKVGDRGSIWSFDSNLDHRQEFTDDKGDLNSAINGINSGGWTALWDAVIASINDALFNSLESNFPAVVILTDGADTASGNSKNDAVAAAASSGIPVFMIGFADDESEVDSDGMIDVAEASNEGFYRFASSPEVLDEVYEEISQAISILSQGNVTRSTAGSREKGTTRASPNVPWDPTPVDGARNQVTGLTLKWECTDPDGDPLTYDVYFGKDQTPDAGELRDAGRGSQEWNTGVIMPYETYYWKIVAHDASGSTEGPVWSFSTGQYTGDAGGAGGAGGSGSGSGWGSITYPLSPTPKLGWNNITSPPVDLTGSTTAVLSFFHKYNLLMAGNGGVIMIGIQDGADYKFSYVVPATQYTSNFYLGGESLPSDDYGREMIYAWNGVSGAGTFEWDHIELDIINEGKRLGVDFTSSPIKIRFGFYNYGFGVEGGWWIDDVKVVTSSDTVVESSRDNWQIITTDAHSGTKCWWNGNVSSPKELKKGIDNSLYSKPIDLTRAQSVELVSYFKFNLNPEAHLPPDGFRIEISSNNGLTWTPINEGARAASGLSNSNTTAEKTETGVSEEGNFWVPASSLSRVEADISAWTGNVIIIRFRICTNNDVDYTSFDPATPETWGGIFIDDIKVIGNSIQEGFEGRN